MSVVAREHVQCGLVFGISRWSPQVRSRRSIRAVRTPTIRLWFWSQARSFIGSVWGPVYRIVLARPSAAAAAAVVTAGAAVDRPRHEPVPPRAVPVREAKAEEGAGPLRRG